MNEKQTAIHAATEAAKFIKQNLGKTSSGDISNKSPFDFVTEIDKQCERQIIEIILREFPEHEILAEETGASVQKNSHRWIIDPLDGTTNFIHGLPHSAVSIAHEIDGSVVLGVVYDPYRDELFFAEAGRGAYCNNTRLRVSARDDLTQCLIATGFPFRNKHLLNSYWEALSKIFLEVSGIRRTGSATLDLAYVAYGRFDGFWELKLSPWDIAAGHLIIKEAGGIISDFNGEQNHIIDGNVVAGNACAHAFMLKTVQSVFGDSRIL